MDLNRLALMQLCDSNFPTGAFSHSFGLESYIQENKVHDEVSFLDWLQLYLNEQLVYTDGIVSRLVYQALQQKDYGKVWELDRKITVQNLPRETRDGTQKMGERMLYLTDSLFKIDSFAAYKERIKKKESFGHPAIVFTMVAYELGVPEEETLLYYLYSAVSSLVQNAVRAIPLGQTAGQRVLHTMNKPLDRAVLKIQSLDEDHFGITAPGLELSQMKHERVTIRIFMS